MPNITIILRRNISFKIPPAEVELTSASKFEEYILTILKKAMGDVSISFTSLITGRKKGKNNFENVHGKRKTTVIRDVDTLKIKIIKGV